MVTEPQNTGSIFTSPAEFRLGFTNKDIAGKTLQVGRVYLVDISLNLFYCPAISEINNYFFITLPILYYVHVCMGCSYFSAIGIKIIN